MNQNASLAVAGPSAAHHTLEFFTARIPNAHTREAYGPAVLRFCHWCEERGVPLEQITSPLVASYLQHLKRDLSTASVKQYLAGASPLARLAHRARLAAAQ